MIKNIIINTIDVDCYARCNDMWIDQRIAAEVMDFPEFEIFKPISRSGKKLNIRRLQKWGYRAIIARHTTHRVNYDLHGYVVIALRHPAGNTTIFREGVRLSNLHKAEQFFAQGGLK